MSGTDIEKGTRGLSEVVKALDGIKIGISCITPENLPAPWLLFEAGGLSKTVDDKTRLCTYLLGGLNPTDVTGPLSMFQAARADRDDTKSLLHSINGTISNDPIPVADLDDVFAAMWPQLEKKLQALPEQGTSVQPKRSTEDMITEILEWTRAETGKRADPLSWREALEQATHTMVIEGSPSLQCARPLLTYMADLTNERSVEALRKWPPGALKRASERTTPSVATRHEKGETKKE